MGTCHTCGKVASLLCTACRVVRYCDVGCQTIDWLKHQNVCVGSIEANLLRRTKRSATQISPILDELFMFVAKWAIHAESEKRTEESLESYFKQLAPGDANTQNELKPLASILNAVLLAPDRTLYSQVQTKIYQASKAFAKYQGIPDDSSEKLENVANGFAQLIFVTFKSYRLAEISRDSMDWDVVRNQLSSIARLLTGRNEKYVVYKNARISLTTGRR